MTLKVTDVEMELISDPNIYLMIESGIQVRSRGRKGELQALADRKHIKHRFGARRKSALENHANETDRSRLCDTEDRQADHVRILL